MTYYRHPNLTKTVKIQCTEMAQIRDPVLFILHHLKGNHKGNLQLLFSAICHFQKYVQHICQLYDLILLYNNLDLDVFITGRTIGLWRPEGAVRPMSTYRMAKVKRKAMIRN